MKKRSVWVDYTMIIVGAFIMGFAIKNMYDPVNLVTGGVSGVAIIMKELARVPCGSPILCSISHFSLQHGRSKDGDLSNGQRWLQSPCPFLYM